MKKSILLCALSAMALGAGAYQNPVVKGFYPDPSVCRVDSDYYLVNSSFEYFPGVPLFHSRDLVNWEQIGYVLDRESQLKVSGGQIWGGIYAPTIRYNDGTYYMVTTNNSDRGNFLVYTDDPRKGWSDPVWLEQGGIDPSMYFEDGRCYFVSNPDGAIWLSEIEPKTGRMLSEPRKLWAGTGGRYPEGPHIYKRDGWYYLLISEGGTEYGHKVTIARSRDIYGPYESNPANPILTHINQNAQANPIQGVGHADMVQAHDGSWWLVCLGFRIADGQHHVLGRETFVAPVQWNEQGWPVVNTDGTVSLDMDGVATLPEVVPARQSPDWDFNNSTPGMEWNWIGLPVRENYSLTDRRGFLRIKAGDKGLDDFGSPSFLGRRQEDLDFQATTRVEATEGAAAGITAYLCPSAHYDLYVQGGRLMLRYRLGELLHSEEVCAVESGKPVELRVKGDSHNYYLMYSLDGREFKEAGRLNLRYLSSETNGGFTGVFMGLFVEGSGYADFDWFKYMPVVSEVSPKLADANNNPLLDFHFTADPTAVEHNGRLYVYATNDHQQYEAVGRDGKNSYEKIKSLVMMSTDDMVNWTYHGLIDVEKLAPWIIASWAPSVTKRVEKDGKTHFYLYFSNSGYGTGVLTATNPLGPWTSPLEKSLVDASTPGLGDIRVPFDPGVVIDDHGTGWLSVGAGKAGIMRLGKDMISIDSEIVPIPAPHHFEANELNYINGTYVYTYNTDWQDRSDWPLPGEVPTICSMCYMTSTTPLDPDSWKFGNNYLKNSGDYGFTFTNNHTHIHKFCGKWYVLYHSMELQRSFNTDGGFRNVCVDELDVDEPGLRIAMASQTRRGVDQIRPFSPFRVNQAETVAATHGMAFVGGKGAGNMLATPAADSGHMIVRGVEFAKAPKRFIAGASGHGVIEVRRGAPDGALIAELKVDSDRQKEHSAKPAIEAGSVTDLCLVLKGGDLAVDYWQFK